MPLLHHAVCGFFAVIATTASVMAASPNVTKKPVELAFEEHKVKKGETLWGIAQKHSTSVGEIMDCNRLPNETVRDGMTLKIPLRKKNIPIKLNPTREAESIKEVAIPSKPSSPSSAPAGTILHTVTADDTFYSIGKKYGLPMESVISANPTVKAEQLREGMKIIVPKSSPPKSKDTAIKTADIKVKTPETSIAALTPAKKITTSEASEKTKTTSPPDSSSTDAKKITPASKPVVVASKPAVAKPDEAKPKPLVDDGVIRSYIVSAGEDENTISEAFGISKKQLLEYNRLSSSTNLKPGDEIMIPHPAK
ncbi:hypothetical protein BH11VER1_BH11VER1_34310 [soil metagenome]